MRFKQFLSVKILFILVLAGFLTWINERTDFKLGLDLQGGTQLSYQIDLSSVDEADKQQVLDGIENIIRKRVDNLGVAEPSIYFANVGDQTFITVELAGIKDPEEAQETIGKTIQLEFKVQNDATDENLVAEAQSKAQEFYNAAQLDLSSFESLALQKEEENPDYIQYTEHDLEELQNYPVEIQESLKNNEIGSLVGPIQVNKGFIIDASGTAKNNEGILVAKIVDRETQTEEVTTPESVSIQHILIAYEGAERSESTLSQEEALALAQELQDRIENGEDFAALALEYSDDQATADDGGDLGAITAETTFTQPFKDAAFLLEPGQLSEVVETEFGYHLIYAYDKTEESTTTVSTELVAIEELYFKTTSPSWKSTELTGQYFDHADVTTDNLGRTMVTISFDSTGAALFKELTEQNIGKPIAIFVGGEMISSPVVNTVISNGQALITKPGGFSDIEAETLVRDLNTGAIPAPLEEAGQYTISASLGNEAFEQSLFAGLIGLGILGVFMILYYRLPGVIAMLALALYTLLMFFFVKVALPVQLALLLALGIFIYLIYMILKSKESTGEQFLSFLISCFVLFFLTSVFSNQITLSLAGIAGIILSIGMAVDANILIFERLKEELREGKSLKEAIQTGFDRAWDSIRDSNFSSLITCAILFYFGTSIIKGFAVNLALGILISMFTAITVTRTLLLFTAETRLKNSLWAFGKPRREVRHFPFIKLTKVWMVLSGLMVAVGIGAILIHGLKPGMDFTGGTLMELRFDRFETADLNTNLLNESLNELDAHIVSTDQGTYLIRSQHLTEEVHAQVLTDLTAQYGAIEELRFTSIGPTIGANLKTKAFIALGLAAVMIIAYIAFAFRSVPKQLSPWRFGISALLALAHDLLFVVGLFAIFGKLFGMEIDAFFITAMLTVMGFSVHDTIVVFDRLRENLKYRQDEESLDETANRALNQTLARSINTSVSTLITIIALLLIGPESIKTFVLALTLGIAVGTYSSIFVATPFLVWWNKVSPRKES